MTSWTASRKVQPNVTATPDHSSAPMASNTTKLASRVRMTPAMLVATAAKPGMNLATINDGAPQRS